MIDQRCLTRRDALQRSAMGFGALALRGLLADRAQADVPNSTLRTPHFASKAKRIVMLFMDGGV